MSYKQNKVPSAFEISQDYRETKKQNTNRSRMARRDFTTAQAQVWVVGQEFSSPEAGLIAAYLASWFNPFSGGTYPGIERIGDSLAMGRGEVLTLLDAANLYEIHTSNIAEMRAPFTPETRQTIAAWAMADGAGVQWMNRTAPVKYEVRYCRESDGNKSVHWASVMLAGSQKHNKAQTVEFTVLEFAGRVGATFGQVASILDRLKNRGWVVERTQATLRFTPSERLLARWTAFEAACIQPSAAIYDKNGNMVARKMSAGARESAWEHNVWRPRMGLGPVGTEQTRNPNTGSEELDTPTDKSKWHLYDISEETTGCHYIGITQSSLRHRLNQHITQRLQKGFAGDVNIRMSEWLAQLAATGKEPTVRLIADVPTPNRHVAEAAEHQAVLDAIAEYGAAKVLNIEHNPTYPEFANLCNSHPRVGSAQG